MIYNGPFRGFVIAAKVLLLTALPFFAYGFAVEVLALENHDPSPRLGCRFWARLCSFPYGGFARDSFGGHGNSSARSSTSLPTRLLESHSSCSLTASMQRPTGVVTLTRRGSLPLCSPRSTGRRDSVRTRALLLANYFIRIDGRWDILPRFQSSMVFNRSRFSNCLSHRLHLGGNQLQPAGYSQGRASLLAHSFFPSPT